MTVTFGLTCDLHGEVRLMERSFGIVSCPLAEAVPSLSEQMELEAA